VQFQPSVAAGAVGQWYHGHGSRRSADPVTVTSASTITGIDAQLAGAASISGNAGGPGVTVAAYSPSDAWVGSFQVQSKADGTYTLAGLAAGSYKIAFFPPGGPIQWYGGSTRQAATSVVVTGGALTGIDRTT
jgi:hypothetical protein